MCREIDFTLSIQISHDYHLFLARENDSCESCSKSHSQIWTFQCCCWKRNEINVCGSILFLIRILVNIEVHIAYGNNVLSHATIFHWHTFFAAERALAASLLRSGRPKMSTMKIMVNVIKAITMECLPLMVRKLEAMLNNFCMFLSLQWNLVGWIQTGFTWFFVVWLLCFCSGWN